MIGCKIRKQQKCNLNDYMMLARRVNKEPGTATAAENEKIEKSKYVAVTNMGTYF
jgi:hypothetical protein